METLDKRHRLALARAVLSDHRTRLLDYVRLAEAAGATARRKRVQALVCRCDVTIGYISDQLITLTRSGCNALGLLDRPAAQLGPWAQSRMYPHRWRLVFTYRDSPGGYAVDEQGVHWTTFNGGAPVPCALCLGTPHRVTRGWRSSEREGRVVHICSMHAETRRTPDGKGWRARETTSM